MNLRFQVIALNKSSKSLKQELEKSSRINGRRHVDQWQMGPLKMFSTVHHGLPDGQLALRLDAQVGCAETSPIQPAATSKSHFADAV